MDRGGRKVGKLKRIWPPTSPINYDNRQNEAPDYAREPNRTTQRQPRICEDRNDAPRVQRLRAFFEEPGVPEQYIQNRWQGPQEVSGTSRREPPRQTYQVNNDVRRPIKTDKKRTQTQIEDEAVLNGTSANNQDQAFRKIKKKSTGFLIWRIENLTVIAVPKEQYGTFYDQDSYVVYAASAYGQPAGMFEVSRELRGNPEYHIHFWLGKNTTPDKSGVAAYKTVELDAYLGGAATQHREAQGSESPRFKSYFKDGTRVLSGGTGSGFRSVKDTFVPKLYQVKGKRAPAVTQMPDVSWKHFNSGDVFLLHTKETMFVWVGRAANPIEKLHATKAALQLRDECNTPHVAFIDDGYERTLDDDEKRAWERFLPLHERSVAPAVEDDVEHEQQRHANIRLYQCSDSGGRYRVTEVKTGPLCQEDLLSDDVFILDHGALGIWVWVGKRASEKERYEAMRNARGFVKKKHYPPSTAVTRVVEGAEPTEFKMLFINWKNRDEAKGMGKAYAQTQIAKVKVTKFDAATMHDRPVLAAKVQLLDDGSGHLTKWRVKRFDIIEQPKETDYIFYNADCYIILYNYTANGQKYILYYWMGLHSSQDEQGAAALKTIEVDKTINGKAVQVRVTQGHEPAHFLQLFKGKFTIFTGKGTDVDASGRNSKIPNHCLLQVQGSISYDTKAIQVALNASSLSSNYCFVVQKPGSNFLWCGKNSNGDNRQMARGFSGNDAALIMEGNESSEFWHSIGGKGTYVTVNLMSDDSDPRPARLFQCSTASGTFKAEELFNFVQTDLAPEDVMLLDAHSTVFLWIGDLSTKEEQKLSLQTALEYLKTDPAGRDLGTPIIQIKQGNEPPTFTGFFGVWDDSIWEGRRSYEELRDEIEKSDTNLTLRTRIVPRGDAQFDRYNKYPTSVLKGPNDKLPAPVDPLKKELHLTHDDFVSVFKMDYQEFDVLPSWKKKELKKSVGLF